MKPIPFILLILPVFGFGPCIAYGAESPTVPDEKSAAKESPTLGRFLEQFSAEYGIHIYLDERLRDRPVNPRMQPSEPAEAILRRVTAAYSRAYAYTGPSKAESRLQGIWVFEDADPAEVDFLVLPGTESNPATSENEKRSATVPAGDTARTITGKDLLNQGVRFTRSPIGTPVTTPRARRRQPDYRPSAEDMRKARAIAVQRQKVEELIQHHQRRQGLLRKHKSRIQTIQTQEKDGEHRFVQKRPDF